MSVEETQAAIDAYLTALVAREDIAPFFSDDAMLVLADVDQVIEGRRRWPEPSSGCTSRASMPGRR